MDTSLKDITRETLTAYLKLPLVCHFAWLDSVVNWNIFTQEYLQEHRSEFQITEQGHCGTSYKDLAPGYVGDGQSFEDLLC
ncbi:UNVERIFIED_CONTAM: hypothetical protein FKN15_062587 [Acipenser sinensis]